MFQAAMIVRGLVALVALVGLQPSGKSAYQQGVEDWRQHYEAYLTGDEGWLTVSGLFWLHEGQNSFGSGAGNDVVLPAPVPAQAGHFDLQGGKVVVHVNPGVPVTMDGKPVETAELRPDSKTDRLRIGELTFFVHENAGRYGIRLKDKNSALRKQFAGLHWFPVDESYRVTAHFVPYSSPRKTRIEIIDGNHDTTMITGYLEFQLAGKPYRLEAEHDDDTNGLFVVFRDLTSRKETYPAARFLDVDSPKDGVVELDFNKAYNPPCAYNPYATCPLPTLGNRLAIAIPAGEKRYHQ
jgi:uncharacterized protein